MDRHVFIATPSHSGEVCCEHAKSLFETTTACLMNGIPYSHAFSIGNALIHDARNRMVGWFMASPATDLLFIDADIAWDASDAIKLITSPHDVIGGAYRQKRDDAEMYNVANPVPGATGLIECDYLGTGFLKISRRAIERMTEALPETRYQDSDGNPIHAIFDTANIDGTFIGEDALFCRRWRELGGKVFMAPGMTLWHVGRKAYGGNFAQLIAREKAKAAA